MGSRLEIPGTHPDMSWNVTQQRLPKRKPVDDIA